MKTNNAVAVSLVVLGCTLLPGCGSKKAKDQAQSDQRSAQEANQALSNVDHQVATGLYGQKPATPPAPPAQKSPNSTQPQPAPTAPQQ